MARVDIPKLYEDLEKLGEQEVRNRLASNAVYGGDKAPIVQEWLRQKDQARLDAVTDEQISIARAAADAARDSANAARDSADAARDSAAEARVANRLAKQANTIAKTAIAVAAATAIIAAISIIVTMYS